MHQRSLARMRPTMGGKWVQEPKWTVREYQPDDLDAVRDLFEIVYHLNLPKEHFDWKYHRNPAGKAIISLAEIQGRIVGLYALWPTRLSLGGEVVMGGQAVDAMTHPDYRRQGIFVATAEKCITLAVAAGYEVAYAFPDPQSFQGQVQKLGYSHVGEIPRWKLNLADGAVSGQRLGGLMGSLGFGTAGSPNRDGVEIRKKKPKEEEWMRVAEVSAAELICGLERSVEWFRWRFDPASQIGYQWFTAYRDGAPKAWAVFGVKKWGQPLIDVTGTDSGAMEAVVSEATRHAKKAGVKRLRAFTNDGSASGALKSCGYVQAEGNPLLARPLTSRILPADVRSLQSWRITSQDSDTF